jgi:hypothetical protein
MRRTKPELAALPPLIAGDLPRFLEGSMELQRTLRPAHHPQSIGAAGYGAAVVSARGRARRERRVAIVLSAAAPPLPPLVAENQTASNNPRSSTACCALPPHAAFVSRTAALKPWAARMSRSYAASTATTPKPAIAHRMVSALTLLRMGDQPEDRAQCSCLLLADEIRRVSSAPEADLQELFFHAAVSNPDDHPRDQAVLGRDRSWRLSPAYDRTPTPAIAEERRDLAMTCAPYGRYANPVKLIAATAVSFFRQAAAIFDHTATTVKNRWRPLMRSIGATERDCEIIVPAFVYGGPFLQPREA